MTKNILQMLYKRYEMRGLKYDNVCQSYFELIQAWDNKDFSKLEETLDKIMKKYLTEPQIQALRYRSEGYTHQEIGEALGVSTSYGRDLCVKGLFRLAKYAPMRALTVGYEEFLSEEQNQKIQNQDNPANPEQELFDPYVFSSFLHPRTFNQLFRHGVFLYDKKMSREELQAQFNKYTPSNMKGVGTHMAKEIIEYFKSKGFDMTEWENQLEKMILKKQGTEK